MGLWRDILKVMWEVLGPSVSWGLNSFVALSRLGATDLSWGRLPGPFLQSCYSSLYEQTPLEGRAVHAGSRHLTTLPDSSSPMALSTFPPGVLEVKKGN